MTIRVILGDMREELPKLGRVHAIVTDPPYHLTNRTPDVKWCIDCQRVLGGRDGKPTTCPACGGALEYQRSQGQRGFMGKAWDGGDIAFQPATWRLCFDLLPPGGHLLAFGGTRRFHRLACAIEDAGFEIRDTISYLYGSGFPKSHNVSKAIDRAAGAEREVVGIDEGARAKANKQPSGEMHNRYGGGINDNGATITAPATDAARQWDGWGTALKPAMELICVARKPLVGTVAANVLAHGTGALNIGGCRVETDEVIEIGRRGHSGDNGIFGSDNRASTRTNTAGRWPANVAHDGSAEVVKAFPDAGGGFGIRGENALGRINDDGWIPSATGQQVGFGDSGSAARFFFSARPDDEKRFWYSSKADADDRLQSRHPTVKPVDLMRWLVRLVTPPGGTVLDPFAGSGTTGMACMAEGFDCILIEREAEYVADIEARIAHVHGDDTPLFANMRGVA